MSGSYSGNSVFGILRTFIAASVVFICLAFQGTSAAERQTVVIFGASGKIGGIIVVEALERGHKVVGISRNPAKLSVDNPNFSAAKGDVTDVESFKSVTQGADSVVISVQGNGEGNLPENSVHARAAKVATDALAQMKNAPYVIQVGGATTMLGGKEEMLKGLPFPAPEGSEMYGMFFGHLEALNTYRASDVDWTVITPPMNIEGWSPQGITNINRTGTYRTSTTELVKDAAGKNRVNVADLAVAVVDELEKRHFVRQRFTVGY